MAASSAIRGFAACIMYAHDLWLASLAAFWTSAELLARSSAARQHTLRKGKEERAERPTVSTRAWKVHPKSDDVDVDTRLLRMQ